MLPNFHFETTLLSPVFAPLVSRLIFLRRLFHSKGEVIRLAIRGEQLASWRVEAASRWERTST